MGWSLALAFLAAVGLEAGPAWGLTFAKVESALAKSRGAGWQAQPPPWASSSGGAVGEERRPVLAGAQEEDEVQPLTEALALSEQLESHPEAGLGSGLPAAFDWRQVNQGRFLPPPTLAQGACGACVSFAVMATLETQLNIACGLDRPGFDLSRQFFFSCGGGSCRSGWKLSSALQFLAEQGVPDHGCLPYDENGAACERACPDATARSIKPIRYERPTTGFIDPGRIKQALLKGPLVANLILYEDLEFYKAGVYRHVTGRKLGSHAVALVGWSDADQAWIARNSWGEQWGDGGYFKVAWDDVSLPGRYTWLLDVSQAVEAGVCAWAR